MKYIIYFQFFNKKMKTTIKANSKEEAEYLLRGKIEVLKVEEIKEWTDRDVFNFFNKFCG